MKLTIPVCLSVLALWILTPLVAKADSITMSVTYYTISETDRDIHHLKVGVYDNEVQTHLGFNGFPVLNTTGLGCTSGCFTATPFPTDVLPDGELTYWSPTLNNGGPAGMSDVVETGTTTITTPYNKLNFFPPNGTGGDDYHGFQSAVYSSLLHVPTNESISFSIGANDVGFAFLDGSVVCDLGGLHTDSVGTCTSSMLSAGDHSLELFYADLENNQAAFSFDVTTANVSGSPSPEPTSVAFIATALGVFGSLRLFRAGRQRHTP